MTRIIAALSFFLLIPAMYWDAVQQTAGDTRSFLTFWSQDPGYVLLISVGLWVYMFVIGHVVWLACRLFNKVMAALSY